MPGSLPRHSVPYALLGALAALSGCGAKKPDGAGQPTATATGAAGATATATATATSRSKASRTVNGKDVTTRFGDVQVAVTLQGGRITDVKPVTLPSDRPRSQYISEQASPILRSEVLAAQSARIDLVSGASYTSDAWAASVQSALDQAG